MVNDSNLAKAIESGKFIITAEYLPDTGANGAAIKKAADFLGDGITAVNISDNPFGVAMSSLAASVAFLKAEVEPVYQLVTRDRNRIALQSDLLGAASLGIKNALCLSGYHQTLTSSSESSNVYDIDSTQLISVVKKMNGGELLDGTKIDSSFSMLTGAVANPYLKPLELNIIRLANKIDAGAAFIQTHVVFDVDGFAEWIEAAGKEGITDKTAILAGVLPLESAEEGEELREKFTDYNIPDGVIERLKKAGSVEAQKREGMAVCAEIIKKLKGMKGLRGIHIFSGGKEQAVSGILSMSGLK